jgi:cob(I)alamin adenosyltransferase
VGKDHPRVEAYGTVDEANSAIGLAGAALPATHADMLADLEYLQNALFDLGADLATRAGGPYEEKLSRMDGQDVERLVGQKQIKTLEAARNTRRPQQPVT